MKTTSLKATLALTVAVMALSTGAALAESTSKTEYKKDGGYEASSSSSTKTATGATVTTDAKTDVDVDSDGKVTKTVKSEKTIDPKGVMNEKVSAAKTEVEQKDNGYVRSNTNETLNADGTSVVDKTNQKVKVDADGNVIETTKVEKTVDPKGLLNQKTTKTETKRVNGQVVETTRD